MKRSPQFGVTLIDTLVGVALFSIIFLGLMGLMRASLLVASLAKAKAGATAIADNQMEYIRSLPYESVGTVGGIPAGSISQNSTTTMNGIPYGVRTFIEYVDDPADGTGGSDTNGITTDYKRIKVSVTYTIRGVLRTVSEISNYAPKSIETTTNGGTLKIVVVNATGAPVSGATVRVVNASTSPTVDLTTFSDSTGTVLLGGAATSTQYQIYVSKAGYSSAQTYARDGTNQNPNPGYLTVVKNQTTTGTFAIDLLATQTIKTYTPIQATSTTDVFANDSKLSSTANTRVIGGTLILADDGAGGYVSSGSAQSNAVSPIALSAWTTASTTLSAPGGTSVRVTVVDGTGAALPDSALPGNSTGFQGTSIDLSGVSTSTYPTLALRADLSTSNASNTPAVDLWSINALAGPLPEPNVGFTLTGAKTVGSTGGGAAIYKTTITSTTGTTGSTNVSLEWDSYGLAVSGYDVTDACYAPSYSVSPGGSYSSSLMVGTLTSNSVLVSVSDNTGNYVQGATVTLSRSGFSQSVTTSACGTAYFGALTSSSAYTIQISKTGYTTASQTNVNISGHLFYSLSFP